MENIFLWNIWRIWKKIWAINYYFHKKLDRRYQAVFWIRFWAHAPSMDYKSLESLPICLSIYYWMKHLLHNLITNFLYILAVDQRARAQITSELFLLIFPIKFYLLSGLGFNLAHGSMVFPWSWVRKSKSFRQFKVWFTAFPLEQAFSFLERAIGKQINVLSVFKVVARKKKKNR